MNMGREFQGMINGWKENFRIITYQDFITVLQKMELAWERREWVMTLWARYCALELSKCASSAG
jgi:hypothetical protein